MDTDWTPDWSDNDRTDVWGRDTDWTDIGWLCDTAGMTEDDARHCTRSLRFDLAVQHRGADAIRNGADTLARVLDLATDDEPELPVHDADDDTRPPVVLLADTVARHAPPARALTRPAREERAA